MVEHVLFSNSRALNTDHDIHLQDCKLIHQFNCNEMSKMKWINGNLYKGVGSWIRRLDL